MGEQLESRTEIGLGAIYMGLTVIGAGFATGREIMSFSRSMGNRVCWG